MFFTLKDELVGSMFPFHCGAAASRTKFELDLLLIATVTAALFSQWNMQAASCT